MVDGSELDLDAVAVRQLDDLEHRLLVEMRLGEDQLVRTLLLEQHGQPVERADQAARARFDREPADDVDPDAAVRGAERSFEIVERRVVDRPAAAGGGRPRAPSARGTPSRRRRAAGRSRAHS